LLCRRYLLFTLLSFFFLAGCQSAMHKPSTVGTAESGLLIEEETTGAAAETEADFSLPHSAETDIQTTDAASPAPSVSPAEPPFLEQDSAAGENDTRHQEDGLKVQHYLEIAAQQNPPMGPVYPQSPTETASRALSGPPAPAPLPATAPPAKPVHIVLDEALEFCQTAQDFWQKGELENALEALDQAYALILDIDVADKPDLIQQKEDLRYLISKRILEIYASRHIVVSGSYDAIPMNLNTYVEAELKRFTGPEKQFFLRSYRRSGRYRPLIVERLKAAGLPEELSWLPLIESGFMVKALSRARALGLWQFIPSTGYKFGLKRNKYVDERIDPVKSTEAAIAYLKELHNIFGDWTTVLAAYNCGEGRVLQVIRAQNINYLDNFWDLFERLPFETARYVPRFLAALHIVKHPRKYGLDAVETDPPFAFETAAVSRQVQLTDVAREIGVPVSVLKGLNPELHYNILPPETYTLKVPPDQSERLLAVIDAIPIAHPPRPSYLYHRVRRGETLSGIAQRYRSSVRRIMQANNLRRSNYIVAGQKLKIPQKGVVIDHTPTAVARSDSDAFTNYVVRGGDSLWILARRFGTTTRRIQEINNLDSTRLYKGQSLKIPGAAPPPAASKTRTTYLVKRGDNPYTIARRHNMPLERFLRVNNLTPRSKIYPGQELTVE